MVLASSMMVSVSAQQVAWRDPSSHQIQFVTDADGVRLEALDWGGSGRAVVLLAGSGNTAHVFDEFAPKLSTCCHVYGITRRGFGASTQTESGYDEQHLADDILHVLDALRIRAPVIVGHSMAGGEMTVLASRYPDRISGLVYLDALFDAADFPASDPAYLALAKKLPQGEPPAPPTEEERRSFAAYRARQMRMEGFAFPEAELHAGSEAMPDGSKGPYKTPPRIFKLIGDGAMPRDYSKIRVPVLSITDAQPAPGDYPARTRLTAQERANTDAYRAATLAFVNRWKKNLQNGPPSVRFVDLEDAGHYLFLKRETEVLREVRAFVAGIP
jgi:non-heme chloroperoxidase